MEMLPEPTALAAATGTTGQEAKSKPIVTSVTIKDFNIFIIDLPRSSLEVNVSIIRSKLKHEHGVYDANNVTTGSVVHDAGGIYRVYL